MAGNIHRIPGVGAWPQHAGDSRGGRWGAGRGESAAPLLYLFARFASGIDRHRPALAEVDLDRIGCHHINDLRHPRYVAKRYSLEAPAPTPRPSMVVNAAS
jgi:hypothetical protein